LEGPADLNPRPDGVEAARALDQQTPCAREVDVRSFSTLLE
jgi:hypothetical protein